MKDALTKILRASEVFTERLSAVVFKEDEFLMQKLTEELAFKNLNHTDFEKMLCDFAASITGDS